MRRMAMIFLALSAASLPCLAEEIALKDGTKIVGHMTAVSADTIEVETSYGKVQLKRADILTISFPENNPSGTAAASAKQELPVIDESLNGTQYLNRTGKFSLALPNDWVVDAGLRRTPGTLAALSSHDKSRFVMVTQEEYPGSLESYKEVTMLHARQTLANFEELSQSSATIDGKTALLVFYRGTLQKAGNIPVEFVSALIQSGNTYTKVSAWCVEPLFHDVQPSFEKILSSYHASARVTSADASKP
jgi:hypothetical protein